MASVSVSYVVGWENNRKRVVWLFCFSFTSEANRPASAFFLCYITNTLMQVGYMLFFDSEKY